MINIISANNNSGELPGVVIVEESQKDRARSLEIAKKTGGFIVKDIKEIKENNTIIIYVKEEGVSIGLAYKNKERPVFIDFLSGSVRYRVKSSSTRNEAIARAVGLKLGSPISIIDTTAGLGEDGFILASLGANVVMLERNILIYTILSDAILRANADKELETTMSRIKIMQYDSIAFLNELSKKVDVVYMDPMFPEKNNNANSKKEMRLLRQLVGEDPDIGELFCVALKKASKRVVIKRPLRALYVNDEKPHFSIKGKACRFDVYMPQG